MEIDDRAIVAHVEMGNAMSMIPKLAALVAVVAVTLGVLSGTGYKAEWWGIPVAFTMLEWALYTGGGAAALGLVSLFVSKQRGLAIGIIVAGGGVGLFILMQVLTGGKVPMIHDITTDTENPPQFVKIVALRGENSNSLDYANAVAPVARGSEETRPVRELQEGFYTDIKPLDLGAGTGPCFTLAAEVAGDQGWEMVNVDPEALIVEATDTTFWFGFKDDVVIRVTGDAMSCRVDMRSVSRVGISDVGVNADRIKTYMAALEKASKRS